MDGQRTTAMPLDIDEIIKALSHPVRRDMLRWLKEPEKYFVEQDHPFEIGVCAGNLPDAITYCIIIDRIGRQISNIYFMLSNKEP